MKVEFEFEDAELPPLVTEDFPLVRAGGDSINYYMLNDLEHRQGHPDMAVRVVPLQLHFHSISEHVIDGVWVRACLPFTHSSLQCTA